MRVKNRTGALPSRWLHMISETDIALRLAVAAPLGSLIGFEREQLMWSAGIRTHILVAIGACLLMIVSAYGFMRAATLPHVVLDPSRISAQVVSGIRFLGAGSILLRGQTVRGLTIAASIWSVAALGLAGALFCCGRGDKNYSRYFRGPETARRGYRACDQSSLVKVRLEPRSLDMEGIKKALGICGGQIKRVVTGLGEDGECAPFATVV